MSFLDLRDLCRGFPVPKLSWLFACDNAISRSHLIVDVTGTCPIALLPTRNATLLRMSYLLGDDFLMLPLCVGSGHRCPPGALSPALRSDLGSLFKVPIRWLVSVRSFKRLSHPICLLLTLISLFTYISLVENLLSLSWANNATSSPER